MPALSSTRRLPERAPAILVAPFAAEGSASLSPMRTPAALTPERIFVAAVSALESPLALASLPTVAILAPAASSRHEFPIARFSERLLASRPFAARAISTFTAEAIRPFALEMRRALSFEALLFPAAALARLTRRQAIVSPLLPLPLHSGTTRA